jgi:hypothetical protein
MKKIGYNISTYNWTHTPISQMLLSPNLKEFSPLGSYHDGKEELLLSSSSREQRERM